MQIFRAETEAKNLWLDFFITKSKIFFAFSASWNKGEFVYRNYNKNIEGFPIFGLASNFYGYFSFYVFFGYLAFEFRFLEPNPFEDQ
jgi:hypothetical protein